MENMAVFLDRDGTINEDMHYLDDPNKFILCPGVGEGVKQLKLSGYKIIIITNQSGIGRGFFSENQLIKIHERMRFIFRSYDVTLDGVYFCPHLPEDDCNCRKPKTGLFEKAKADHNIEIQTSFMIGDQIRDIIAGKNFGLRTLLIPESRKQYDLDNQENLGNCFPDFIANNFSEAVNWILNQKNANIPVND